MIKTGQGKNLLYLYALASLFLAASASLQVRDPADSLQTATSSDSTPEVGVPRLGTVLWSADFETGDTSQWYTPSTGPTGNYGGGMFNSGNANSVASRERARSGSWSLKTTATTARGSGTRLFRWREPQNNPKLYYSVWYYFPQRYSVRNYWNVFQWKSKRSSRQIDPFFVVNVGNRSDGPMYFYLYNWQKRQGFTQSVKNIPVGQWFKVEAYYACAGDGSGRVTFWQDGTQLFDVPNVQTRYSDGDCQWSVDNYSDTLSPTPASVYIDDLAIYLVSPQISGTYKTLGGTYDGHIHTRKCPCGDGKDRRGHANLGLHSCHERSLDRCSL